MKSIQAQLEELGLGEKETKVYLAGLELGSATVQEIAAKSAIVRASTYVAIGGLTKLGLMSTYTKGKKKYFTAEPPEKLLKILQEKRKKLAIQESKLKEVMPELQALISLSADKPEVKYYEGLEGLETMREKIFESKAKELFVVGTVSQVKKIVPDEKNILHSIRMEKAGILGKTIVFTEKADFNRPSYVTKGWKFKVKRLNHKHIYKGEIAIFGEYVSLISYQDKPYGFIIRSSDISSIAKQLFNLAWGSLCS